MLRVDFFPLNDFDKCQEKIDFVQAEIARRKDDTKHPVVLPSRREKMKLTKQKCMICSVDDYILKYPFHCF